MPLYGVSSLVAKLRGLAESRNPELVHSVEQSWSDRVAVVSTCGRANRCKWRTNPGQ